MLLLSCQFAFCVRRSRQKPGVLAALCGCAVMTKCLINCSCVWNSSSPFSVPGSNRMCSRSSPCVVDPVVFPTFCLNKVVSYSERGAVQEFVFVFIYLFRIFLHFLKGWCILVRQFGLNLRITNSISAHPKGITCNVMALKKWCGKNTIHLRRERKQKTCLTWTCLLLECFMWIVWGQSYVVTVS